MPGTRTQVRPAAPYTPATRVPKEALDRALEALVARATTDAAFRARALGDPAGAFAEIAGMPLPRGLVLRLVDNAGAHLSMVLPDPRPWTRIPTSVRSEFRPDAPWTEAEARKAAEALVARATSDAAFRLVSLRNAAVAVEALTGKRLPHGFTLRLVDNARAHLSLVLPDLAAPPTTEVAGSAAARVAERERRRFRSGFSTPSAG